MDKSFNITVQVGGISVEWYTGVPTTEEIQAVYDMLAAVEMKKGEGQEKLASEAQKKLLRQKGVAYSPYITSTEAYLLLKKNEKVIPDKSIQ